MRIIIAGGGIGGLSAALCLHGEGIDVTVLESVREMRPLGVGINLQPRAVGELINLGLGANLEGLAVATAENVYTTQRGDRVYTEPRGLSAGHQWPQYSVHRGWLQMVLLAAVRDRLGPGAVRTGTRLDGFTQSGSGVLVTATDRRTGALNRLEADVLVGADGLHSAVRPAIHPRSGPLLWSGIQMWRGTAEATPFLSGRTMILANDERRRRFLAYPISPRHTDRGLALINWVALVPTGEHGPVPERASWNRPGRAEDVLGHFADWNLGWLDVPKLITDSPEILEYPMVDRDPLPRWSRGRITLLGDAAHPMYPIGANGASQAILDARALATAFTRSPSTDSGEGPAAALSRYEATRRPDTTAVVLANREMDQAERETAAAGIQGGRPGETAFAGITGKYAQATSTHGALLR